MRPNGWDESLNLSLERAREVGRPWEGNQQVLQLKSIVPAEQLDIAMMAWAILFEQAYDWFYTPLERLEIKRSFWLPKKRRPIDMLSTTQDADDLRFIMVEMSSFLM